MNQVRIWWQAFRYHFVPPSILPAILGGVIAWSQTGNFYAVYFILTVLGVTFNHIALNMTDDYFDYQTSVDRAKGREKNPYSGGSGTITSGLIKPKQMLWAFFIGYLITIIFGLYLTAMRGWIVFTIGAFGIACAYFYTAPPIRYGYHGLGEISQLINFSLTIGMGAYYVQAESFSWESVFVLLPLGFMMFSMITINEIPDEKDDREGGKNNLVVKLGATNAVWLYGFSMLISYLIIAISPLVHVTSFWIYLSLITFPWFVKAFSIALKNYRNPVQLAPANMFTIKIHNITGILLICAFIIDGFLRHGSLSQMILPLILLFVLYLPVALTIFFNYVPLKPASPPG